MLINEIYGCEETDEDLRIVGFVWISADMLVPHLASTLYGTEWIRREKIANEFLDYYV